MRPAALLLSVFTLLLSQTFGAPSQGSAPETLSEKIRSQANKIDVIFTPLQQATLEAKVVSVVKEIYKKLGDPIEEGELLIQLDDQTFSALAHKAQLTLDKANAVLSAKQQLFKDKVSSLVELKTAESDAATAQAALTLALYDLESCKILAPYHGHVADVLVHEHEQVQVAEPLVQVVNDRELIAKMLLPSDFLKGVSVGDAISIYVDELDVTVPAKITHIGAVLDPASSMFKVYAQVNNSAGTMRAGMIGSAYFKNAHEKK